MKTLQENQPQLSSSTTFIDTHCHLDMTAYGNDLGEILARASHNHIDHIVTIGIDVASSKEAINIARRHRQVSATIGIHPHDVDNLKKSDYIELEQLYLHSEKQIVGYGEIGLDYFKNYSDPAQQQIHFAKQLDLAHEFNLPIIVHNRDADEDTLRILREAKPLDYGGIMHCFSGDLAFAQKVIDLGMLISIPGIITFKNATDLHKVAREIPLKAMVLETDGPFLAPHPYRGKRNEPSYLLHTAQKIAELRQIDLEQLSLHTTANARNIFKLKRTPNNP